MLQVEKGVSINNLGTLGDSGRIVALIIKRDNELAAQEAMQANESPTLGFAEALSARLATEINLRNEIVEREVDKERLKKMARKTVATLAGGFVGWLIGGKLFKTEKLDLHAPYSSWCSTNTSSFTS